MEQQIGEIEVVLAVTLPPHDRRFHPEAKEGDECRWLQADSLMFHTVRWG